MTHPTENKPSFGVRLVEWFTTTYLVLLFVILPIVGLSIMIMQASHGDSESMGLLLSFAFGAGAVLTHLCSKS